MYYNPTTSEQKELSVLSREYNASFPKAIEVIDKTWYLLHFQTPPVPTIEQEVRNGGIKKIDGKYWQTYELAQLPAETVCERVEADFTTKVTDRLNAFASEKGYESITTACTYSSSSVPTYKAEGEKAVQARDDTWNVFYTELNAMLDEYKAGTREVPTWEEVEAKLPTLSWDE